MKTKSVCLLLFVSLFFILSCSKDRLNDDNSLLDDESSNSQVLPTSYQSVDEFFLEYYPEEQMFIVDTPGISPIIGKEGTKIWVDNSMFEYLDKSNVDYPFQITLIEIYKESDMIFAKMPTVSNGQILQSGGEIKVTASKNGQEIYLKSGRYYTVEFKSVLNPKPIMDLFYGDQSVSPVNWINDITVLDNTIQIDSLTSIDTTSYGYLSNIARMNWVNCDRFASMSSVAALSFNIDSVSNQNLPIYVVLPELNSVILTYGSNQLTLPKNQDVVVLMVGITETGILKYYLYNFNIDSDTRLDIILQEINETQLVNFIRGIGI